MTLQQANPDSGTAATVPAGTLSRIVRYPVKGLRGIDAGFADVRPGRGLRHDRILAIDRRTIPVVSPTGWSPRETYFHVAKDEGIVALTTEILDAESDEAVLTIGHPDGWAVQVRLAPEGFEEDRTAADALLGDILPSGPLGRPALSRPGAHLWDWPQAHLSIINLATLRALEETADAPVDWRRFRGNLYLDGLEPWEELSLLGRRIRIGSAVLEIFQPTDRCRATTIDPVLAESNLNVPALLASEFGHMFCGVYARVLEAGRLVAGGAIEVDPEESWRTSLDVAERDWPRAATIAEKRIESPGVTSLWLADSSGIGPGAVPGQHIRVHMTDETAPSWRCYTVSAVREGAIRISVKRDGRVSRALHAREEGERILLSGPFGEVVLNGGGGDVLLLSAGIGITPTAAMINGLAAAEAAGGLSRRVRVVHIDRTAESVALWNEVVSTSEAIADCALRLFLTREDAATVADVGAQPGRPNDAAWRDVLSDLDLDGLAVYACGPSAFTDSIRKTLTGLGVPEESIEVEVFFSPTAAALTEPREPSTSGPHAIRIGDDTAAWTSESGSTLDAVEGIGIPWPSGCRMGACGTCAQRLVAGEIEYISDPLSPAPRGTVLVCCSVPTTDVEFALP
ncbi:UNVERIFIED_CONTAM: MOSC domain-containing protein [Microbacterium sp. SLM126]